VEDSAFLDELMADAWPPQVTEYVGRSRLRWALGFTRRANSCLVVGGDDEIPEILARATEFYESRATPPVFLVSTASAPPSLADRLQTLGFEATAETLLMAGPCVAALRGRLDVAGWVTETSPFASDAWLETYWGVKSVRDRDPLDRKVCRSMLLETGQAAYVSVVESGETIAVGQIVVDQGWAGVQCMATRLVHRRRGAAAIVLGSLAGRAIEMGAQNMYLAVMHSNSGARELYERLGFSRVHEYSYFSHGTR
jgi:N-acetylglutamate synthase